MDTPGEMRIHNFLRATLAEFYYTLYNNYICKFFMMFWLLLENISGKADRTIDFFKTKSKGICTNLWLCIEL